MPDNQEKKAALAPTESEGAIPLEALFDDNEDYSLSELTEKGFEGGEGDEVSLPILVDETAEEAEEEPFVNPDQESLLDSEEVQADKENKSTLP